MSKAPADFSWRDMKVSLIRKNGEDIPRSSQHRCQYRQPFYKLTARAPGYHLEDCPRYSKHPHTGFPSMANTARKDADIVTSDDLPGYEKTTTTNFNEGDEVLVNSDHLQRHLGNRQIQLIAIGGKSIQ